MEASTRRTAGRTELHKAFFIPLSDKKAPEGTRAHTLGEIRIALCLPRQPSAPSGLLLERFSVADAHLYTVLNWTVPTRVELTSWPAIPDYRERLQTRPSISRAVREEYALYDAELARHQAA
jgi:glutathione S-transferase